MNKGWSVSSMSVSRGSIYRIIQVTIRLRFLLMLLLVSGPFALSCRFLTGTAPLSTPTVLTSKTPFPPTSTPVLASPSATATLKPPTATSAPFTVTPTGAPPPFLPTDLEVIQPQNAGDLQNIVQLPAHGVSVMAFSPDGSLMGTGFFDGGFSKVWKLASGVELSTLSGHVNSRILSYLTFSPDGHRLASGSQGWEAADDSLMLWDVESGEKLHDFLGYLGAVSGDWRTLAQTARENPAGATLSLLDLETGEELFSMSAPGDIYAITFSPDGRTVAAKMYSVYQDLFTFWDVETGMEIRTQYDWTNFSYSPDGRFIAAVLDTQGDPDVGELVVFDAQDWSYLKTLSKEVDAFWYTVPTFSPDGRILAASLDDYVTLWDTETWAELTTLPMPRPVGLIFSPDGRIIASHPYNEPVKLWGVIP